MQHITALNLYTKHSAAFSIATNYVPPSASVCLAVSHKMVSAVEHTEKTGLLGLRPGKAKISLSAN